MNFTKILKQIDQLTQLNKQIDKKFLTETTVQKKYKSKKINQIKSLNGYQSEEVSNKQDKNNTLLKNIKHRYYADIIQDQIEDKKIFGYTTYECLNFFNRQQMERKTWSKKNTNKYSNNKTQIIDKPICEVQSSNMRQSEVNNRPKTAIIPRLNQNNSKRRVHHKLSLNQIQKAAVEQNILPQNVRQQFFTQQFFDFNGNDSSQNRDDLTLKNIRCGSRTATFYKNVKDSNCLKKSKFVKTQQVNKQNHFSNNQFSQNINKKHYIFKATTTNFYNKSKKPQERNFCKKIKYHLDEKHIKKQQKKLCQQIENHFNNLQKKDKSKNSEKFNEIENKSIVYHAKQRVSVNLNENTEVAYNIRTNIVDHNSQNEKQNKANFYLTQSNIIANHINNNSLFQNNQPDNTTKVLNLIKPQTSNHNDSTLLNTIRKYNKFLLTKQQIKNIKFHQLMPLKINNNVQVNNLFREFDERLINCLKEQGVMEENRRKINNVSVGKDLVEYGLLVKGKQIEEEDQNTKRSIDKAYQVENDNVQMSFPINNISKNQTTNKIKSSSQSKNKYQYTLILIICSSLKTFILQNIQIENDSFIYKEISFKILSLVHKLLQKQLPKQFIHLILTKKQIISSITSFQRYQHMKKNGSCQQTNFNKNSTKQTLVYQTFIHNSDIKYFQGRQIQIQYFKYFMKRFMMFDGSIKSKNDIDTNLSLILSNQIKIPEEYEEFCKQMKVKEALDVVVLKNQHNQRWKSENNGETGGQENMMFKSVEINLLKLLMDANETIMMIKKELFQGYDWRGVSLKKDQKKFRGYHLQHFYI